MIPENYFIEMGKAVALDILGNEKEFRQLEKELEEIENIFEAKNRKKLNKENYPMIGKVLNVILRQQKPRGLKVVPGSNTKREEDDVSLKTFEKDLSKKGEIKKLLEVYLNEILFKPPKTGMCSICNARNGSEKRVISLLKQSNPTDYTEGGQIDCICNICNFWIFLSNYYPSIVNISRQLINKSKIYYVYVSNSRNLLYPTLFYANFLRYVKHKTIMPHDDERVFLVFYKLGDQSSNNSIISYGEFNILRSLKKMTQQGKKQFLSSVNNFHRIFLFGKIATDENHVSGYIPLFVEMIQNDMIPTELMKHFLTVFRENPTTSGKEYRDNFNMFTSFIQHFFEVNNMKDDESSVTKGWRLGRQLISSIDEDHENFCKWITALSGMMQISEKEFMKGMLQIQRRVRSPINTKDLDGIAKNDRLRTEYLVGLLSGVNSSVSNDISNGGEENE